MNSQDYIVDYSDTTYFELQEIIQEKQYSMPVILHTPEGYMTVLTDGWTDSFYMSKPIRVHYYKILTYLPDNIVQSNYFGADGVRSCTVSKAN